MYIVTKIKFIKQSKCRWRNKLSTQVGRRKENECSNFDTEYNVRYELFITAWFQIYIFWDVTRINW